MSGTGQFYTSMGNTFIDYTSIDNTSIDYTSIDYACTSIDYIYTA